MNELISVVIPVYNVETYLDACVRSVMKQTYSNIEIILVDDGATDNSGEMCDFYAKEDSRVKVIHKDNGGLGLLCYFIARPFIKKIYGRVNRWA